jgi:hypothetical protein
LSLASASQAPAAGRRLPLLFCCGLVTLALLSLVWATVTYEWRMLRTSVVGVPYPASIYQLLPTPGMKGGAGADFSQVYTSALALRHGESPYQPTTPQFLDRFGRPSGYPPLTNWIYVPLSFFPYETALTVHAVLSLLLLLGLSLYVLGRARLWRHAGPLLLAETCLYLFSPIGFTHLERGQFDLIVASGVVAAVGCLQLSGRRLGLAAFAGLVGALKWTAVSFLGSFAMLGFLLSTRRKRLSFVLIPLVMALGTAVFGRAIAEYWVTIQVYELYAVPFGLTFTYFFSSFVVKLLPVIATLTVASLIFLRNRAIDRPRAVRRVAAPFALALANMAVCFGTLSYEYHTVSLLGLLPGLVTWMEIEKDVSTRVKGAVGATFAAFLMVAFRLFGFTALDQVTMTVIYGVTALFFLGVAGFLVQVPGVERDSS